MNEQDDQDIENMDLKPESKKDSVEGRVIKPRPEQEIREDMKKVEYKIDQIVEHGIGDSEGEREHYDLLGEWHKLLRELRAL